MPSLQLGLGTHIPNRALFRGVLDDFGGAAAAYSLEKLRTGVDNVVRVRRSSDDTEQDFNATQVSNGELTNFCGAGDGFVVTWYDQSGNSRDAEQATSTDQVQIVNDGAIVEDGNDIPSTLWDGVDDDFDVPDGFAGLTAANVYAVTDNAGTVTLNTLTAQDISADTKLSTILTSLTSLTYDKVAAVIIYQNATSQTEIQAKLNSVFGT